MHLQTHDLWNWKADHSRCLSSKSEQCTCFRENVYKRAMRTQFEGMWGGSWPRWGCYPLNSPTACRTVPTSGDYSQVNAIKSHYSVFRDSLHSHEKELERTSQNIKELIKEVKNLVGAAKNLSRAQRSLSDHLVNFKFDCIGSNQVKPIQLWLLSYFCLRLMMNWSSLAALRRWGNWYRKQTQITQIYKQICESMHCHFQGNRGWAIKNAWTCIRQLHRTSGDLQKRPGAGSLEL